MSLAVKAIVRGIENQNLGPEIEAFLDGLVESGRYQDRAAVLRESMRLMQERESGLAEFRVEMARRVAAADAGHLVPAERAFDELEDYVRALAAKTA